MKRLKRIGDSGQPCLSPVLSVNQSVSMSLILTQEVTFVYKDLTADRMILLTPTVRNLSHKILRLIWSYAFLKSIKAQYIANLFFFLVSIIFVIDII